MVNNMDVRNMYVKVNEQVIDKPSRSSSTLPHLNVSAPEDKEKNTASVNVTLSEEGKEKSKQAETKDHFKSLREKDPNAPVEEESKGDVLDELIEELKDKIATLQAELAKEQNHGGGESENRVKQIKSELGVLQAQLMGLLNQKMEGKSQS